ncbi:MAG: DUF418 domain-containing protein [Zhengella sp.]|uniref:DUF418 domain-containing protein n=1 Tax=Zhengella sp. TaxID=2282762 RepID=UPI001E182C78|nr:DUF418 domain-containing protein [Notoacmeibacter sp.]MCC0028393.1 DUF418 domain-containing protein [Brucellaceae bacterium]
MIPTPFAHGRHALMDAGRGFAILGILWLNIFIFALPLDAMGIPGMWGETMWGVIDPNVEIWRLVGIAVDGVMRGMISILFGATALILLTRAESAGTGLAALDPWYRRQMALIAFGVIHAYLLLWPYDILYLYGLFGLFLFPVRKWSPRRLWIAAALMMAMSAIQGGAEISPLMEQRVEMRDTFSRDEVIENRAGQPLREQIDPSGIDSGTTQGIATTAGDAAAPGEDDGDEMRRIMESIESEIIERQQGYLDNVLSLAPVSFQEQTSEVVKHHVLDVYTFMLIGMALLKSGFLTGGWSLSAYRRLALGGLVAGTAIGWFTGSRFADGSTAAMLSDGLLPYVYDIRRLCFVFGFFSLLALLMAWGRARWLTDRLEACGRLALTLYIGQSAACMTLFFGFGFGLFGRLEHIEIAGIALAMTLVQLLAAPLYVKRFGQGPLERLLRRITHGREDASA